MYPSIESLVYHSMKSYRPKETEDQGRTGLRLFSLVAFACVCDSVC